MIHSHTTKELYEAVLLQNVKQPPVEYQFHEKSNKIAVIIDPRYDELMAAVIHNFMYHLNPRGWNLMIFATANDKDKIKKDFPNSIYCVLDEKLIYYKENPDGTNTSIPNMHIGIYNRLLMDSEIWNIIPAEHIALFQKDCIMYKMLDEEFLKYDYAGANVYVPQHQTFFNGLINGGFSLRKKSAMLECIAKIKKDDINNYIKKMNELFPASVPPRPFANTTSNPTSNTTITQYDDNLNEDIYFTFSCEMLQKTMPDKIHRRALAIEYEEHPPETTPAVHHGWNKNYHSVQTAVSYLTATPGGYFTTSIGNTPE